jgi:hypothetical protein
MANPSDEACTANTWTKVATAVTTCNVTVVNGSVHYRIAIRENPGVAPASDDDGEFLDGAVAVKHSVPVDVFVFAVATAGTVRVYA